MLKPLTNWARNAFIRRPVRRRRRHADDSLRIAAEVLEVKSLLSVTLAPLIINDLPTDKTEFVAADVTNTVPGNTVQFNVTSSNPDVQATVLSSGRSIDFNISGVTGPSNTPFTGDIIIRLFEGLAPNTTAHIISLAQSGFYNGLTFHRVLQGFVAQGGDPLGNGTGGSGPGGTVAPIPDEFSTSLTYTSNGLVGMANAGHDTNDSQFFITAVDQTLDQLPQHLNFENPIFGIVTSGFDILNDLMATQVNSPTIGTPLTKEKINSATVFTDTNNGVIELQSTAAPSGTTGTTTITIMADDGHGSTSQQQASIGFVNDTANDPPFLGTVLNQTTNQGTPVTFTVQGVDIQNDPLTFVVKDPSSFAANGFTASNPANVDVSIQVTGANGATPSFATITLTPQGTFSGTINMIIGVRDNFLHNNAPGVNSPSNFDTQEITLTVNPVNHAPTTPGGSAATFKNTPVSIQLTAATGDPDKTQTLTYIIDTPPTNGKISDFNAATGALTYTPNTNYSGPDSFTYKVMDNGGTSFGGQDTSALATFNLLVSAPTLTVTADDKSVNLGDPLPLLTASYSGFVNGDTLTTSDVTGSPVLTTTATASSPAGDYPIMITQGTLASNHYSFAFSNGTLHIFNVTHVAVTVKDGVVTLTGDLSKHTIGVTVVNGNLELTGTQGTEFDFNGTTQSMLDLPISADSLLKGLVFNMPGSDAAITIDGTGLGTLTGNVMAVLGNGKNSFELDNTTVAGDVNVYGGTGGNTVSLTGDTVRDASIVTGQGTNSVTLTHVTLQSAPLVPSVPALSSLTYGANLYINTGGGNNIIELDSDTGTSSLLGGVWVITTGFAGNGIVTLDSSANFGVTVVAGSIDNNTISVEKCTFGKSTVVTAAGTGQNLVQVTQSMFMGPAVLVSVGGSAPLVSVDNSTFQSVAVMVAVGPHPQVKVQTASAGGSGAHFFGPAVGVVAGAGGTISVGNSSANGAVILQQAAVFIGDPVNRDTVFDIATSVTNAKKLFLFYAKRNNV